LCGLRPPSLLLRDTRRFFMVRNKLTAASLAALACATALGGEGAAAKRAARAKPTFPVKGEQWRR
jgi:hypothetical protein